MVAPHFLQIVKVSKVNERKQKGLLIAATCYIAEKGKSWLVPSQTRRAKYTVTLTSQDFSCSCLDFETTGHKCKHIYAVEYMCQREDGIDTPPVESPKFKKTYPQYWKAYNAAQTNEKDLFQRLLYGLCRTIAEPVQKLGRPRIPHSESIFSACFKVYSTFSGRRFMHDLRAAESKGYITKVPHFNSIYNCLEKTEVTEILKSLIVKSSLPLKSVEIDFACDSSGFAASRFEKWHDYKYGGPRKQHLWVKAHVMTGVKTNIVTAVEVLDKDSADVSQLPSLVKTTAENFSIMEVSADKIYGSIKNYEAIESVGATPYIPFKSIHTGSGDGLWSKMFHCFQLFKEDFLEHYHKRSNVESTFSMVKAKFRDHVRSKTDVAMRNEVLCKFLCHNICCVIQEMHELGISPEF